MDSGVKLWLADKHRAIQLLAAGFALRLVWITLTQAWGLVDEGEATSAAVAVATRGVLADALFPGEGATAHLMPTMPVLAGAVIRLLGTHSVAAGIVLAGWALAQALASFVLLRRLFARIGFESVALVGGLTILCLVPAYVPQESADFRYWEGALAACLATLNLLLIADLDGRPTIAAQPLLLAAALSACTFFVSPTAGLAIDACWAMFVLRRLPFPRALRFAGTAGAALALLVAPWMLRNACELGTPIALRSNFGLELALANHDGALSDAPPREVFDKRMAAIHPHSNPDAAARLQAAGGEAPYSQMLGAQAAAWIRTHPLGFARLALRHYRQFYLPDTWQGGLTNWEGWDDARVAMIRSVDLLGLAGLALGLWRRRRFYPMLALYIAASGLPYALVQPIPRYSYLVWGLFAFLAARFVVEIVRAVRGWLRASYAASGPGTER